MMKITRTTTKKGVMKCVAISAVFLFISTGSPMTNTGAHIIPERTFNQSLDNLYSAIDRYGKEKISKTGTLDSINNPINTK